MQADYRECEFKLIFLLTYPCFQYIISCCVHSLRENLSSHNSNLKYSLFSAVSQPKISKSPHKNQACHRWHGIFSGFYARHTVYTRTNPTGPSLTRLGFTGCRNSTYFWDSVIFGTVWWQMFRPCRHSSQKGYYTIQCIFFPGGRGGRASTFFGFSEER